MAETFPTKRTAFGLATDVPNSQDDKVYFVSTGRKIPLQVWETAVFYGFAGDMANCLFVKESYVPASQLRGMGWLAKRRALKKAEQQGEVDHRAACEMVANRPVNEWRMTLPAIVKIQESTADDV